jgi:hypothetical protein
VTQPNAVASFFTGGGKGITWPDQPGKTVSGTITAVHPPEPVKDLITGQPTEKQQIRIDLTTSERDPEIEFDDGSRTLYVKSYMRSAIGDALKKVGEKEPKVGGTLTVSFVRLEPPERPGLNPGKIFEAVYQPPAVTGNFFGGNGQPGQQQAAPPQQYAAQTYTTPPQQPVQQQVPVTAAPPAVPAPAPQAAPAPAPQAAPGIPKPPGVDMTDQAWALLDDNTRRTVAAAVGAPPF